MAVACAALVAAGTPLGAAPTASSSRDLSSPHFTLTTAARYDDNLFLADSNATSDTIVSAAPGAAWHWGDPATAYVALDAQENFVRYLRHSIFNDSLAAVQLSTGVSGTRTQVDFSGGFDQTRGNTRDLRGSTNLARHDHTTGNFAASYQLAPKTSVHTGLLWDDDRFQTGGFYSTREVAYPLTLAYALSPKMHLNANYRYRDVQVAAPGSDFVDHVLGFSADGEFASKLTGRVGTNWIRHDESLSAPANFLGFDGALTWAASSKLAWTATASREFRPSPGTGLDYASTQFGLQNSWSLAEFWSTQADVRYEIATYGAGRRDRLVTSVLTLKYAPSTIATFSFAYILEHNLSSFAFIDYNRNALSVSATLHY